jgi:Sec-independent protein translocase protein TatA
MLSHLKNYFNRYGHDIFIIAVIILVALIFFGLGRLTAPTKESIQIIGGGQ